MPPQRPLKQAPSLSPQLAFGGLENLLGYHLRRAQGAFHRDFLESLSELELTQKQVAALYLISANLGVSQVQIAGALDMDRATTMAIIDRLEQRALLLRRRSKTDRRRQELYLTPLGQKTLKSAMVRIANHERRLKRRYSEEELKALVAALKRLYEQPQKSATNVIQ